MKLEEVVRNRKSVRAFRPDLVSRETISKIVELARWAPSWGNTQPWEIVVADGPKAKELAIEFQEESKKGATPRPSISMPLNFSGVYKDRYMNLGKNLLDFMGVAREDKEARMSHYLNMYRFFGAPAVLYLVIDGSLNEPYSCLDIGSIGTTICYSAMAHGLGSIYLAASMHFPDIVKRVLDIPETKKIVIGIAIGYPESDKPAAVFRSDRAPLEEILRFA
ncbi:MAG: nitroreductase [Deltaproteobacteria bacterium]|nr:nitroreductase [Deltaproteobacteria bacterium]